MCSSEVLFKFRVPIPHRIVEGHGIDGDCCVFFPEDPVAWKEEMEKVLEEPGHIYLNITNDAGGDFALVFDCYPFGETTEEAFESSFPGPDTKIKHFGMNVKRETLLHIYNCIKFALGKTEEVPDMPPKDVPD
jgi:hypothetical protein